MFSRRAKSGPVYVMCLFLVCVGWASLHLGARCLGVLLRLTHYARYKEGLQNMYPWNLTIFRDRLSGGVPMDPLKPCPAPGRTIVSGGDPIPPLKQYLHPKGAAASPPPPLGVDIVLVGGIGSPLKLWSAPGLGKVSGGPLGPPPESPSVSMIRFQGYIFCNHCLYLT